MYSTQKAFTNLVSIYFISLVFIGTFFLFNLTLAIIKVKFSESQKNIAQLISLRNKEQTFDFDFVKKKGVWVRLSKRIELYKKIDEQKSKKQLGSIAKMNSLVEKEKKKMQSLFQKLASFPMNIINKNYRGKLFSNIKNEISKLGTDITKLANNNGKMFVNLTKKMNFWGAKKIVNQEKLQEEKLSKIKPKYLTLAINKLEKIINANIEDILIEKKNNISSKDFKFKKSYHTRHKKFKKSQIVQNIYQIQDITKPQTNKLMNLSIKKQNIKKLSQFKAIIFPQEIKNNRIAQNKKQNDSQRNSFDLKTFVKKNTKSKLKSSKVFLIKKKDKYYELMNLINQSIEDKSTTENEFLFAFFNNDIVYQEIYVK